MPIYTPDLLFDGHQFLPAHTALVVNNYGVIEDVVQNYTSENAISLNGLLCPGFINTHCHLELSHLHNAINQHTGLVPFLLQINKTRNQKTAEEIQTAIEAAENQMLQNGIVAVGDICNTDVTYVQKQKNNLYYHNFIEAVGVLNENAQQRYNYSLALQQKFAQIGKSTIVPHAPYSVSEQLFTLINQTPNNQPISIHNQECVAENQLIQNGDGAFLQLLESITGNTNYVKARHKNSLAFYTELLDKTEKIIFVHNTFSAENDVHKAQQNIAESYWCYCPNANLYIENTLPTIFSFLQTNNEKICLGTDSLASNTSLSIYAEMQTIFTHQKEFTTQQLLQWATSNGAQALGIDHRFGSFAPSLCPGVLHIPNWVSANQMPSHAIINRLH